MGIIVWIYARRQRQWQSSDENHWQLALKRGFRGRCPNCGEGHLFRAFVKVADHCEKCGEPFRYHRADDFPAYLVIVLVGHIVVPLGAVGRDRLQPGLLGACRCCGLPLILGLALGLLQPIKGADRRHAVADRHARLRRREARALLAEGVEHLGDGGAVEAGAQAGLEQHPRLQRMQPAAPDQAGLAQARSPSSARHRSGAASARRRRAARSRSASPRRGDRRSRPRVRAYGRRPSRASTAPR